MIGISTSCFYPLETEKALLFLAQNGVRDVEIFFNAGCETQGELFRTIQKIVRDHEMCVHAVHPYFTFAESNLLFSNYHRRFLDGVELYRRLAEACLGLSCDLLILHGEKEPFRISEELYIERYGTLENTLFESGVRLTQENVVRFRSQNPELLAHMRRDLGDRFRMTFDVKQAVRCGLDPLTLAAEFADSIVHVHLSDHGEEGDCLLPGSGVFPFDRLFSVLRKADFRGDCVVELYRSAFAEPSMLLESYKNLQKFAKK